MHEYEIVPDSEEMDVLDGAHGGMWMLYAMPEEETLLMSRAHY